MHLNFLRFCAPALLVFSAAALAEPPNTLVFSGKAQFWISTIDAENAGIPEASAPASKIENQLARPQSLGGVTTAKNEFSIELGKALVAFYWKRPQDGSPDYISTQVELRKSDNKLLALCTFFELPENAVPLVTGACAGRDGDRMIGITISK